MSPLSVRSFALGSAIGLIISLAVACGGEKGCGPSTCTGCCNASGACVLAPSGLSCGGSGSACVQCVPGEQCLSGFCLRGVGGGGGGGGGSGGGSSVGGSPKRIFVTSASYSGNLGGLAGADRTCNTVAQAANKGGLWKAWLSTSTIAASTRIADVGPWSTQRADGGMTVVFSNAANFGTTPLAPVGVDEFGAETGRAFWTGTLVGGAAATETCINWTSTTSMGKQGDSTSTSTFWAGRWTDDCVNRASLLCVEQ